MPKYNDFDLDVQTSELSTDFKRITSYDPTAMTYCYVCNPDRTINDILTIRNMK